MKRLHWNLGETDLREIDEMANAIVDTLTPFAASGYSAYNGISACVGIICAIAKETKEDKFRSLTQAIELLKEQAVEWEEHDCLR